LAEGEKSHSANCSFGPGLARLLAAGWLRANLVLQGQHEPNCDFSSPCSNARSFPVQPAREAGSRGAKIDIWQSITVSYLMPPFALASGRVDAVVVVVLVVLVVFALDEGG